MTARGLMAVYQYSSLEWMGQNTIKTICKQHTITPTSSFRIQAQDETRALTSSELKSFMHHVFKSSLQVNGWGHSTVCNHVFLVEKFLTSTQNITRKSQKANHCWVLPGKKHTSMHVESSQVLIQAYIPLLCAVHNVLGLVYMSCYSKAKKVRINRWHRFTCTACRL